MAKKIEQQIIEDVKSKVDELLNEALMNKDPP